MKFYIKQQSVNNYFNSQVNFIEKIYLKSKIRNWKI